jgi:hypothetical protein
VVASIHVQQDIQCSLLYLVAQTTSAEGTYTFAKATRVPQYSPLSEDACIRRKNYYDKMYKKKRSTRCVEPIVRGEKHANAETRFSGRGVGVKSKTLGFYVDHECPKVAIYFLIRAFDNRVFLFRCSRRNTLKWRKRYRYAPIPYEIGWASSIRRNALKSDGYLHHLPQIV